MQVPLVKCRCGPYIDVMAIAEDRPLRADARRNREAIVKAARAVFARDGRQAQMDDIARRAKVGVGTVYRHFPTKEALLAALATDRFEQIAGFAEEALTVEEPWEAFEGFLRRSATLQASDRLLSQVPQEQPDLMCAAKLNQGHLQDVVGALVTRAQDADALRADFLPRDVGLVMCSLSQACGPPGASWERLLAMVLDGLRAAPGLTTLPD
jgi:AcrR family transcriptional regulator